MALQTAGTHRSELNPMTAAGPQTGPWACQGTIAAHKGTIGNPPRCPGGPRGFLDLGKIPVKPSPGRVWGEMATPKGFLGPLQTIPLAKNLGKPRGGPIPPQSYVFRAPFLGPQRAPGLPGPISGVGGSKNGSGVKNIKVAYRKTMQNPTVLAPNGAICCKLWP